MRILLYNIIMEGGIKQMDKDIETMNLAWEVEQEFIMRGYKPTYHNYYYDSYLEGAEHILQIRETNPGYTVQEYVNYIIENIPKGVVKRPERIK